MLLVLCRGDVAQAALAPIGQAECALCGEQSRCGAPSMPHFALPATTLPSSAWAAAPAVLVILASATAVVAYADRQVGPLAPRSPPVI
ncbi:MAG: hypothetical protein ACREJ9_13485 [Candidatus Rokuibacteriota bacterium]